MVQDRTLRNPLVHTSGRSRERIFTHVKDAHTEDGRKRAVGDGAVALLGPETVRDDRRGAVWKLTSELGDVVLHAIVDVRRMGHMRGDGLISTQETNKHATYDW